MDHDREVGGVYEARQGVPAAEFPRRIGQSWTRARQFNKARKHVTDFNHIIRDATGTEKGKFDVETKKTIIEVATSDKARREV